MPVETDGRKFRRAEPDERRDLLIRAALRCLAADGYGGMSVRRIAKEANVSIGLVGHHFGSVEQLIAEAYQTLALELTTSLRAEVERAGTPGERLDAFLAGSFSPLVLDQTLLGVWVVFWSLISHSPAVQQAHQTGYGTYLQLIEQLLRELAAAENLPLSQPRQAAIGLSAMLDGLWLEWCLNPSNFSADDGLAICRRWVRGLRAGVYGD